ncbi:MAG: nuclear transport factor 2 family protein [Acidimicrobiales bacterium]|jgi:ketosteroid isomerase-like protein|nr:hypothetical protein [Acidimicrobiaceae bacterium]MDP6491987.1 nuclear transport factor 2 family protein [Acidimicrobiales bacterium]MDP6650301.1 nuclear transport factor 2 family protein [Acidimicrobiales bacterium]MDP6759714.1 nuclear transport factor 2 family protein [Acidimicrobiales bacterium]|tara:strand:+ start:18564 stop:19124 length:561 start_codon:yes stop_codon:yes gene_type:complete
MSGDRLERLTAEADIRQLVARYAVCLDKRDLDGLVALFVPDVQVGRDTTGRRALHDSFATQLATVGVTILNTGTHQIDLGGPGAEDLATGHVYCKAEIQDGDRWIHQAIRYDDTYRRVEGRWLFVRRIHRLFYGAEVGENPLALAPANWPAGHTGMGTLPFEDPTWQDFNSGQDSTAPTDDTGRPL